MNRDTGDKLIWYFEFLAYFVREIASITFQALATLSPAGYVVMVMVIVTLGIFAYFTLRIARFMFRFMWVPVVILMWEAARHYAVR